MNRILDRLADNELQVKVDAIDETRLMEGLQKIANRIALGLVLAALIVGAALLMQVETSFRLFGYPGLAILLFLAAAAGGVGLAVSILASDIQARRKRPEDAYRLAGLQASALPMRMRAMATRLPQCGQFM